VRKPRKPSGLIAAAKLDDSSQTRQPSARTRVEWILVRALHQAYRNPRTHSKKQVRQIARSIEEFGFINPIVIDEHGRIIAGHGRFEAAKLLGLSQIPVIRLLHLSEAAIRAYMLADNKLAEKAGWDRELLAIELSELELLLPKIDLELSSTGFEPGEIDSILADFSGSGQESPEDIPDPDLRSVVSQPGDLFVLGRHRFLVGDAREPKCFDVLMQADRAAMGFHDPPYNVQVAGHVGGRGRTKHGEFVCASGEMSSDQFVAFLHQSLSLAAQHSIDGAIHYVCMDWRHANELFAAGAVAYAELKNICVWVKTNAGQGSFYRSQYELIFVFKHGAAPHLNTFELGQHGRSRSNVWHYAGVNTFRAGRMDELRAHPTVKPLALVVDAMRDCSRRGDIVLDAFVGSGTTIIAAEQVGRRAFCMEIDPIYADVCIRRWQAYTKRDAVLASTGETFDELADSRPVGGTSVDTRRRSVSPNGAAPRRPNKPGPRASRPVPAVASAARRNSDRVKRRAPP